MRLHRILPLCGIDWIDLPNGPGQRCKSHSPLSLTCPSHPHTNTQTTYASQPPSISPPPPPPPFPSPLDGNNIRRSRSPQIHRKVQTPYRIHTRRTRNHPSPEFTPHPRITLLYRKRGRSFDGLPNRRGQVLVPKDDYVEAAI